MFPGVRSIYILQLVLNLKLCFSLGISLEMVSALMILSYNKTKNNFINNRFTYLLIYYTPTVFL